MKFNQRLKELRINSPHQQKEIAEMLGIAVITFQQYESGKREPNIEKLIALANIFDVTLDYLLCRYEE